MSGALVVGIDYFVVKTSLCIKYNGYDNKIKKIIKIKKTHTYVMEKRGGLKCVERSVGGESEFISWSQQVCTYRGKY